MNPIPEIDPKDREILQLITHSAVSVKDLTHRLFMSEATVRRRLAQLEARHLIIRTHGGAILNKDQQFKKNLPLYLRTTQLDDAKAQIARKALPLLHDGDTIFVDSSSTALFLLPHLSAFRALTVCTNSLKAATMLAELEIPCLFFGGDVHPGELSCNSEETAEMIARVRADLFFFSCDALSPDGSLTDHSKSSSYLRRQYLRHADRSVLLLDDSKFGKTCPHLLCPLSELAYCISNVPLPAPLRALAPRTIFL